MSSPLLLTIDEVAALLRVSRSTVKRMLREGRLTPVKVRRRTLIHRWQVEVLARGSLEGEESLPALGDAEDARKERARSRARRAKAAGKLEQAEACEICGRDDVALHGHHDDYDKPLDVRWLCPLCHAGLHARERAVGDLGEQLAEGNARRTMPWLEEAA